MDVMMKTRRRIQSQIAKIQTSLNIHGAVPLSRMMTKVLLEKIVLLKIDAAKNRDDVTALQTTTSEVMSIQEPIFEEIEDKLTNEEVALLEILELYDAITTSGATTTTTPSAISTSNSSSAPEIRLPRVELPKFDGDINSWLSFKDLFSATIDNNTRISDVQKMTYLKSSLTGSAAKLLNSLPATEANYDIAWSILKERYENKRELVFSILQRFSEQPITTGNSATALRSLIDVSKESIRSMEALGAPVQHWDIILVFYMLQKLDKDSKELWEMTLTDKEVPKLEVFMDFLEQRARALSAHEISKPVHVPASHTQRSRQDSGGHQVKRTLTHHAEHTTCKVCSGQHLVFKCPTFLRASITERQGLVKSHSLCFNCLSPNHSARTCPTKGTCQTCNKRHHTLIHTQVQYPPPTPKSTLLAGSTLSHKSGEIENEQGMLATALVKIMNSNGHPQLCRAFLDGGSTASFMSESCVKRLGLHRSWTSGSVTGLSSVSIGKPKGSVNADIQAYFHVPGDEIYNVEMLVLPTITGDLPTHQYDASKWTHLRGLQLADPSYDKTSKIDILLGSEIFWDLLLNDKKSGPEGSPIAINSKLGWLVAGKVNVKAPQVLSHHVDVNLDSRLEKFWELESIPVDRIFTKEERETEQHFISTFTRDDSGRYSVSLPFKQPTPIIGPSRDTALRRLLSLERRLTKNPEWRKQYEEFMLEYERLGHMELVPNSTGKYLIPHHFILKESSTTTKSRVVFDASSKTVGGMSLNEALLVGPAIQDNLTDILMRFRTHVVAFTADITKMYRQIKVNQDDTAFQHILWRSEPKGEIREYRLLTVTYGTASAPYHATRVLKQLSIDEEKSLPLGAEIAKRDFYMDDLMSGGPTVERALEYQAQVIELMRRAGMKLCKFSANHPDLLNSVPENQREVQVPLSMDKDDLVKTLGCYWNPGLDIFTFKVNLPLASSTLVTTKRILLSEVAKIFDPLGWLAPVIIRAKLLFQQLWKLAIDWDEALPDGINDNWKIFRSHLTHIENLKINRCICPTWAIEYTLHGFCDASEQAYAAAVYLRADGLDKQVLVSLIMAKTRVAPTKQISLPRLELCGALLLTHLVSAVEKALNLTIKKRFAWTDSTVVLAWLQSTPTRWKTFVANRVAEIQEEFNGTWGHVSGLDNPADCSSRGIDPTELENHHLWWTGPQWLKGDYTFRIMNNSDDDLIAVTKEERRILVVATTRVISEAFLVNKFSSLIKLQRITAWCLRFIHNYRLYLRRKATIPTFDIPRKSKQKMKIDYSQLQLTLEELDKSLLMWIRVIQSTEFDVDIQRLEKGPDSSLAGSSKLRHLNPFLDSVGLIRVGGRLRHAPVTPDQKNPILLPRHHSLTRLIIQNEHQRILHGGAQLVMAEIQKRFWIIGAKDAIRHQIRKCVTCTRHRATTVQQFMGDLPAARVTPCRPFLTCGVDYAGPFIVRAIPSRSKVTFKAYLALFICFVTKSVHLEVVSSMSSESFLAALRRFTARRGKPRLIHSDCGTNFVGANRELREFLEFITSSKNNNVVGRHLSSEGIQWHFNPPGAPHFGGLWEAGVKSVKFHLHRIIGSARLTFEELSTTVIQIEAVLNSRPLSPCSADPEDLTALTPGHFLIGDSLMAIPEADLTKEKQNRLSRWQMTQQMAQHFWRRWSAEYLSRLQQRPKWLKHRANLKIGDMVLIKEDNIPPLKWRLGRIISVNAGSDGLIRVATVKTTDGEIKRPVVKLCLLPIDSILGEGDDNCKD